MEMETVVSDFAKWAFGMDRSKNISNVTEKKVEEANTIPVINQDLVKEQNSTMPVDNTRSKQEEKQIYLQEGIFLAEILSQPVARKSGMWGRRRR